MDNGLYMMNGFNFNKLHITAWVMLYCAADWYPWTSHHVWVHVKNGCDYTKGVQPYPSLGIECLQPARILRYSSDQQHLVLCTPPTTWKTSTEASGNTPRPRSGSSIPCGSPSRLPDLDQHREKWSKSMQHWGYLLQQFMAFVAGSATRSRPVHADPREHLHYTLPMGISWAMERSNIKNGFSNLSYADSLKFIISKCSDRRKGAFQISRAFNQIIGRMGHAVPVVRQTLFLPGTRGMDDDRGVRSFPRPYQVVGQRL